MDRKTQVYFAVTAGSRRRKDARMAQVRAQHAQEQESTVLKRAKSFLACAEAILEDETINKYFSQIKPGLHLPLAYLNYFDKETHLTSETSEFSLRQPKGSKLHFNVLEGKAVPDGVFLDQGNVFLDGDAYHYEYSRKVVSLDIDSLPIDRVNTSGVNIYSKDHIDGAILEDMVNRALINHMVASGFKKVSYKTPDPLILARPYRTAAYCDSKALRKATGGGGGGGF
jgi:hypothetical protein